MRTIFEAMMLAADHIEQHPESYYFGRCFSPDLSIGGHEATACLYGWVMHFLGYPPGSPFRKDTALERYWVFSDRLDQCAGPRWSAPSRCVEALRQYARAYHRDSISQMLVPFRGTPLPWAAMRDREEARKRIELEKQEGDKAYTRFKRGLAQILAMPLKERS